MGAVRSGTSATDLRALGGVRIQGAGAARTPSATAVCNLDPRNAQPIIRSRFSSDAVTASIAGLSNPVGFNP